MNDRTYALAQSMGMMMIMRPGPSLAAGGVVV